MAVVEGNSFALYLADTKTSLQEKYNYKNLRQNCNNDCAKISLEYSLIVMFFHEKKTLVIFCSYLSAISDIPYKFTPMM